MFLNPTTHFLISVSWGWKYDGYYKGHKTKINLYTVTLAHMWLLNNHLFSSFVKNVIIVKHNTSAIGETCPSVVLYCFLKYLRECQFVKKKCYFKKIWSVFCLFQTARTLLILTLHWKAMMLWKYYTHTLISNDCLMWQLKLKLCSGIPTTCFKMVEGSCDSCTASNNYAVKPQWKP